MTATPEDEEANEAVADAGALDFLLADGALGVLRRFRPDGSLLRLAAVAGPAAPAWSAARPRRSQPS